MPDDCSNADESPSPVDPAWIERVAGTNWLGPLWRREYPYSSGRWHRLSLPRKFVCDLLHFAKKIPSVPMQRQMALHTVATARTKSASRVGWCAIFTKAYAIVSREQPELRRCYMPFPWAHLYEHPGTIASVGIEREYRDEPGVFFGRIPSPEALRLVELEALIRHYKTAPIEKVAHFRTSLALSRLPRPLRRALWSVGLNMRGLYRAALFGTFSISVVAPLGAAGLHLLSPLTTTLNYGTFRDDHSLDVRLTYDHRVVDGGTVARALRRLEEVLTGPIANELASDTTSASPEQESRPE